MVNLPGGEFDNILHLSFDPIISFLGIYLKVHGQIYEKVYAECYSWQHSFAIGKYCK